MSIDTCLSTDSILVDKEGVKRQLTYGKWWTIAAPISGSDSRLCSVNINNKIIS